MNERTREYRNRIARETHPLDPTHDLVIDRQRAELRAVAHPLAAVHELVQERVDSQLAHVQVFAQRLRPGLRLLRRQAPRVRAEPRPRALRDVPRRPALLLFLRRLAFVLLPGRRRRRRGANLLSRDRGRRLDAPARGRRRADARDANDRPATRLPERVRDRPREHPAEFTQQPHRAEGRHARNVVAATAEKAH
eukprot:31542-Pelagococcus_subviridis.AAC.8